MISSLYYWNIIIIDIIIVIKDTCELWNHQIGFQTRFPRRLDAAFVLVLVPVIRLSQEETGGRILGIRRDPDNIDFDPANK